LESRTIGSPQPVFSDVLKQNNTFEKLNKTFLLLIFAFLVKTKLFNGKKKKYIVKKVEKENQRVPFSTLTEKKREEKE
jgi:hypothetical protein